MSPTTAPGTIAIEHELRGERERTRPLAAPAWALALAVAIPLLAAYLILTPPTGDLAAATYRSDLFGRVGFTTWDTGWYAAHGHWLPGYSLLSPALGWLLGVHILLVCSALAACVLFALIAQDAFGGAAARVAAAVFAFGFCIELLSGRVPYDLGFAIGLGAVLTLMRGHTWWALVLAVLTSLASPVAGAFLALAGMSGAVGIALEQGYLVRSHLIRHYLAADASGVRTRKARQGVRDVHENHPPLSKSARACIALTAAALLPILALSIAFPEGGHEPFAPSLFWMTLAGTVLVVLLLPRGPLSIRAHRTVRVGAALYALVLIGSFAIASPLGGNAARLAPALVAPLVAGVLWENRRLTLLALAPLLLYWQLVTPIHDFVASTGNPSTSAAYYAPLLSELKLLRKGVRTIVEVPLTQSHWEAAYVAGHDGIALARGWDRQLDTRYGAIFYRPTLSSSAYRGWLMENKVAYVALPDAPLDSAGRLEGKLVARELPYLRELWHSEHWRLYRVMG
jgi:hypothetical protein